MRSFGANIGKLVVDEKERIIAKYGYYKNDHECHSVLLEEIEEAEEELESIRNSFKEFWTHIRSDCEDNNEIMDSISLHSVELIKEAVQIVAIAEKYLDGKRKQ